MSYSGRKRYKSRREKNRYGWRNFKVVIFFIVLALAILTFKNWTFIKNYIQSYFY